VSDMVLDVLGSRRDSCVFPRERDLEDRRWIYCVRLHWTVGADFVNHVPHVNANYTTIIRCSS
jgi:hypothetical protein